MIAKERLQELIEQGATIWTFEGRELKLDKDTYALNYKDELVQSTYYDYYFYELNGLFETKEEAEWHKEFCCIERTERLELPTYKESKEICTIVTFGETELCYFIHDNSYCLYRGSKKILDLPASKESYTLACRKVKELFLGKDS